MATKFNSFPMTEFQREKYQKSVEIFHRIRQAIESNDLKNGTEHVVRSWLNNHLFCEKQKMSEDKKSGKISIETEFCHHTARWILLNIIADEINGVELPNISSSKRTIIQNMLSTFEKVFWKMILPNKSVVGGANILSEWYRANEVMEYIREKTCLESGKEFKKNNFHYPTAARIVLSLGGIPYSRDIYHNILKEANKRSVEANARAQARIKANRAIVAAKTAEKETKRLARQIQKDRKEAEKKARKEACEAKRQAQAKARDEKAKQKVFNSLIKVLKKREKLLERNANSK